MGFLISGSVLVLGVTAIAFALVIGKLLSARPECDPNWLAEFRVERYRPMERLLSDEDGSFLSAQRGFEPAMLRKLRAERRRIFRLYLRGLVRDFSRLDAIGRQLVASASEDRSDLAATLLRQRVAFTGNLLAVELSLALNAAGIGHVDVRALVQNLALLKSRLAPLPVAA
jgi:hypothetical protein